jgi:hypothetical protein
MHRGMTAGAPTRSLPEQERVRNIADINFSRLLILHLGMALQAQVGIILDEELAIDGAVGIVAHRAAFPHRLMLEHKWPRLLPVALRAILVEPRHGQPARWFQNVAAVRIVAFHAIHFPFHHRMALGQMKLGLGLQVALETSCRVLSRIDDEPAATASCLHMLAAGSMATLATSLAAQRFSRSVNPRMRTHRKHADDIRVAFSAGFIADVFSSGDFGRGERGAGDRRARHENQGQSATQRPDSGRLAQNPHTRPPEIGFGWENEGRAANSGGTKRLEKVLIGWSSRNADTTCEWNPKAAEDSRTPKRSRDLWERTTSARFWSAGVLCRFSRVEANPASLVLTTCALHNHRRCLACKQQSPYSIQLPPRDELKSGNAAVLPKKIGRFDTILLAEAGR